MRVFSACLKMMKYYKTTFVVYFMVFVALLLSMTLLGDTNTYGDFRENKPDYALIIRDEGGALEDGLKAVLDEYGTYVELEDSREVMMDAGFYEAVDGIFIVPEDFEGSFWKGEEQKLGLWQRPGTASGYYLQSVAEQYLSMMRLYRDGGSSMSREEISSAAVSSMEKETEVTMRRYLSSAAVSEKIKLFQQFLPYVLLLLCLSGVNIIFLNFKRPEIRMRNLCSPVRPFHMALQKLLYVCVVGAGCWILMNAVGGLVCFNEWDGIDWRLPALMILNSFFLLLVVISVSLLCSSFIQSTNAQSFVTNICSLAMSFLSGVFVPLEVLSPGMLYVARFIPIYWYEENLNKICGLTGFGAENLKPIWQGMALQAGFAAALFCVYLLVNKYKEQAAESYGAVRTEIEN